MSWFYTAPVAKIHPQNKYYFLTGERSKAGYFRIYSPDQIAITTDQIKRLPLDDLEEIYAIPREFILRLNLQIDFVLKTRLTIGENHHNFGEFLLGDVLTKNTFNNPEYLSHAILSAAQPSIDFNDKLLIVPKGLFVSKLTDLEIIQKLTNSMHEAIQKVHTNTCVEFTMESDDVKVKVQISLVPEVKTRFTSSETGKFRLGHACVRK